MTDHTVAYVEWIDSAVLSGTWASREDILGDNLRDAQDPIRSAGILVQDDKAGVVLACSSNDTHGDLGLAFFIPRSAIQRQLTWVPEEATKGGRGTDAFGEGERTE